MLSTSCDELKTFLKKSVDRNYANAILLSGGLDSSILACVAKPELAITVSLGNDAPDLQYAKEVASMHSKQHIVVILTYEKLLEVIEELVKLLKTFNPLEVRNSCVVLAGMEVAKAEGYSKIMTGDGCDELFAGYNYLIRYYTDSAALENELHKLWNVMHFSSIYLGEIIGVRLRAPFLDEQFLDYAKSVQTIDKVGEYHNSKWGKFLLRKCYEKYLGERIAWRPKLAQEQGAGTTSIQDFISMKLDDRAFALGKKDALCESINISNKEHLYYYLLYRKYFKPPRDETCKDGRRCPKCKGCIVYPGQMCRTCGAFPVSPEP